MVSHWGPGAIEGRSSLRVRPPQGKFSSCLRVARAAHTHDGLQEIIRYYGEYISPSELEALVLQYPGVADAAVLGVQSETDRPQVPLALVALGPSVEPSEALAQNIARSVDERVSDHKKLRGGVKFVQAIPRLVTGKMCRDKLQALLE